MADTAPRRAEFNEFIVRKVKVPSVEEPWFEVHIAETLKYLFRVSNESEPSDQPGWLGAIRFSTYGEAVTFGQLIAPAIREAYELRSASHEKVKTVTSAIYREYGRRSRLESATKET